MKKLSKLLSVLLLLALLCLSGCTERTEPTPATPVPVEEPIAEPVVVPTADPAPTPAPTPTPEAEPVVEPTAEPVAGGITSTLTGEALAQDQSNLRPFAVQMNNHQDALPQCGISGASIIYEMPEEGITRMTAIYPQNVEIQRMGSIRSARPYHSEIAKAYDAIFVHWGASTKGAESVYALHAGDDVDFVGNASSYSYRDPARANRATEHTGFVTLDNLRKFLSDSDRRLTHNGNRDTGLHFNANVEPTGGNATEMSVFFVSKESRFAYQADQGAYTMSQYNGISYVDGDTNQPVPFKNVLFLRTFIEEESSLATIHLKDAKGSGIFCCNGKQEPITWSHGNYDEPFHYYRADGSELELGIGRSYICIISDSDRLTIQ